VKTGMSLQDFDTCLNKLKNLIVGPKFFNRYGYPYFDQQQQKSTICWYYNDIVYDGIAYIFTLDFGIPIGIPYDTGVDYFF
jgi:hypothetical protein